MKKTQALLLSILLLILAFTSCNLDGTSGIFREIAQSKKPLGIRYKQLLGIKGTDLYFRTAQGVERIKSPSTSNSPTRVATSVKTKLIEAAALSNVDSRVFYITNDLAELNSGSVKFVDTTALGANPGTITVSTPSIASELSIKGLYANSTVLVRGKDGAGEKVFDLLQYNGTTFISVATFTMPDIQYDIERVIQQTSKEQEATAPMIISFVKDSDRIHYLVEPSGPSSRSLGTEDVQIANFMYHDSNTIYVLSTDGKLYHLNLTTKKWKEMSTTNNTYAPNAFAYAYDDGSNYHLIAKPSTPISNNFPLDVLTFVKGADTITSTAKVSTGYAQDISEHCLISAIAKSSANLLVATEKNGMFEISISNPTTGAGTSRAPEDYTF